MKFFKFWRFVRGGALATVKLWLHLYSALLFASHSPIYIQRWCWQEKCGVQCFVQGDFDMKMVGIKPIISSYICCFSWATALVFTSLGKHPVCLLCWHQNLHTMMNCVTHVGKLHRWQMFQIQGKDIISILKEKQLCCWCSAFIVWQSCVMKKTYVINLFHSH